MTGNNSLDLPPLNHPFKGAILSLGTHPFQSKGSRTHPAVDQQVLKEFCFNGLDPHSIKSPHCPRPGTLILSVPRPSHTPPCLYLHPSPSQPQEISNSYSGSIPTIQFLHTIPLKSELYHVTLQTLQRLSIA